MTLGVPKPEPRVKARKPGIDPMVAIEVYERDQGCVARFDPEHTCEGRLTLGHVPERGQNALGKKPPSDKYHLVTECLKANSGGTQPWSETHRDAERLWLAMKYPGHYGAEA